MSLRNLMLPSPAHSFHYTMGVQAVGLRPWLLVVSLVAAAFAHRPTAHHPSAHQPTAHHEDGHLEILPLESEEDTQLESQKEG